MEVLLKQNRAQICTLFAAFVKRRLNGKRIVIAHEAKIYPLDLRRALQSALSTLYLLRRRYRVLREMPSDLAACCLSPKWRTASKIASFSTPSMSGVLPSRENSSTSPVRFGEQEVRQVMFLDDVSIDEADRPLHDIFQLTDMTRPVIAAQAFQDRQ